MSTSTAAASFLFPKGSALANGRTQAGMPIDYLGGARAGSNADIGAIEASSAVAPSEPPSNLVVY